MTSVKDHLKPGIIIFFGAEYWLVALFFLLMTRSPNWMELSQLYNKIEISSHLFLGIIVLILGGVFVVLAGTAARQKLYAKLRLFMWLATLCGIIFLGMQTFIMSPLIMDTHLNISQWEPLAFLLLWGTLHIIAGTVWSTAISFTSHLQVGWGNFDIINACGWFWLGIIFFWGVVLGGMTLILIT